MPRLERITAGAAALGRPATSQDFGTGAALTELAGALTATSQVTEQIFRAAEQSQIGRARSELAVELNDFRQELKTRPDHENDVNDFEEFKRTATEKHRSTITTERGRKQFDGDVFDIIERARVDTIVGARQKAMAQQRVNTLAAVTNYKNLFIDSDDDMARKTYFDSGIAEIDKAEALGGLTPEKAEQMRRAFEAESLAGLAVRKIRETRTPDEAQEVVVELSNRKGPYAGMDADTRQQFIKTAEGQVDFLIRKERLDIEYEQSQEARQRRVDREDTQSALIAAMIDGKMTTELLLKHKHRVSASMAKMATASIRAGGGMVTGIDYVEVARLSRMEADRPDLFVKEVLDPLKLGTLYSPTLARQRALVKSTGKAGQSLAQALKARTDQMSMGDADTGRFDERFYLRVAQWQNEPNNRGKALTHSVRQEILDDLEQEYKESAVIFGIGKRVPDTDVTAPDEVIYHGVPQDEVRKIVVRIRGRGRQPTPQAMGIAIDKWRVEREKELEAERKAAAP